MTSPAWDGRGQDPWMTTRLDHALQAATEEEKLRRAVWAVLSDWIIQTERRVDRGEQRSLDLDAIWARAPAWRAAVEALVYGPIKAALGLAYKAVFGEDYPWDRRVFVSQYLADVVNRLVRIPDEVHDLVAGQIAQGAALGEGIPKIRDRVDNILSTTDSPRWPNRATVIARTETLGALNAGRFDAFRAEAEDFGIELEKIWLATEDSRTRPTHNAADLQRVPLETPFVVGGFSLMFPGDPTGPPQEVIQCRCTLLSAEPGEEVEMSNRQFKGDRR